jgi:hypothetical protein
LLKFSRRFQLHSPYPPPHSLHESLGKDSSSYARVQNSRASIIPFSLTIANSRHATTYFSNSFCLICSSLVYNLFPTPIGTKFGRGTPRRFDMRSFPGKTRPKSLWQLQEKVHLGYASIPSFGELSARVITEYNLLVRKNRY